LDKDGCQTTSLIVVGLRKCPDVIRWWRGGLIKYK
jgi:hypothetical protein